MKTENSQNAESLPKSINEHTSIIKAKNQKMTDDINFSSIALLLLPYTRTYKIEEKFAHKHIHQTQKKYINWYQIENGNRWVNEKKTEKSHLGSV